MQNKKQIVDCFIPMAPTDALNKTLASLQSDDHVNRIVVLQTKAVNVA